MRSIDAINYVKNSWQFVYWCLDMLKWIKALPCSVLRSSLRTTEFTQFAFAPKRGNKRQRKWDRDKNREHRRWRGDNSTDSLYLIQRFSCIKPESSAVFMVSAGDCWLFMFFFLSFAVKGDSREKETLVASCAFYQLFHVASAAQNKKKSDVKRKGSSSFRSLLNWQIWNAVFMLPPRVCVSECKGGASRQKVISGASQQMLRAFVSQPDLSQTQVRVRGEFCSILWFRGKENEKRGIRGFFFFF